MNQKTIHRHTIHGSLRNFISVLSEHAVSAHLQDLQNQGYNQQKQCYSRSDGKQFG